MTWEELLDQIHEVRELIDVERHGDLFGTSLDQCYEMLTKVLEELE